MAVWHNAGEEEQKNAAAYSIRTLYFCIQTTPSATLQADRMHEIFFFSFLLKVTKSTTEEHAHTDTGTALSKSGGVANQSMSSLVSPTNKAMDMDGLATACPAPASPVLAVAASTRADGQCQAPHPPPPPLISQGHMGNADGNQSPVTMRCREEEERKRNKPLSPGLVTRQRTK